MTERPYYNAALNALQEAHTACFNHPDRGVLGMSSGPFSGVNVALGIVDELESENSYLKGLVKRLQARIKQLEVNDV